MAGIGPLTQDWEPVVIREKAPTLAAKKDLKAVNAARRSGDYVHVSEVFWDHVLTGSNFAHVKEVTLHRALTGNIAHVNHLTLRRRLLDAATNNAASSSTSLNAENLDEETEKLHHNQVLKAFMQTRVGKMVAQAEMAKLGFGRLPLLDWEPVVFRKKAPTAAAKKDEKAVNAARQSGADIETVKKCIA